MLRDEADADHQAAIEKISIMKSKGPLSICFRRIKRVSVEWHLLKPQQVTK
jgi:hypothetical protein